MANATTTSATVNTTTAEPALDIDDKVIAKIIANPAIKAALLKRLGVQVAEAFVPSWEVSETGCIRLLASGNPSSAANAYMPVSMFLRYADAIPTIVADVKAKLGKEVVTHDRKQVGGKWHNVEGKVVLQLDPPRGEKTPKAAPAKTVSEEDALLAALLKRVGLGQ
ncbi:MAG: hypothetical protein ABSG53_07975 [Thermoguttaceae bacterium]|jgi:hypothetical protein